MFKKDASPNLAFLRLRALPCTSEVISFIKKYERIYIVEANRDGQLRQILSAVLPDQAPKFRSACHSDGLPLTAKWVKEAILAQEK
jgi:2-oxoglutarate ferredoxin oxidoreductase subunit alpha